MCDVREAVTKLKLYTVDMHQITESTPGPLGTIDLPISNIPKGGFMKCFLDIVLDVPSFPRTEIQNLMQAQKYKDLPKPFGIAKPVDAPFDLDLAVIPQTNGKFAVVKIINLKDKKNTVEEIQGFCYGKPHSVDWSRAGNVATMRKCLHFIFEQLGGFQCRHHVLRTEEEGKPKQERSLEEWDFGFDYIEKHGPRDNVRNKLLRWVTIQTTKRDSPSFAGQPHWLRKAFAISARMACSPRFTRSGPSPSMT